MSEFLKHDVEGISAPKVVKKARREKKQDTLVNYDRTGKMPIYAEGELAISTYLSEGVVGMQEKMDEKRVFKCVTYGSLNVGAIYSREYKKDHYIVETKGKGENWSDEFKVWVFA